MRIKKVKIFLHMVQQAQVKHLLHSTLHSKMFWINSHLMKRCMWFALSVATREIGFLPGDHEDKSSLYQIPYKNMVKYMFEMQDDNEFEMLV